MYFFKNTYTYVKLKFKIVISVVECVCACRSLCLHIFFLITHIMSYSVSCFWSRIYIFILYSLGAGKPKIKAEHVLSGDSWLAESWEGRKQRARRPVPTMKPFCKASDFASTWTENFSSKTLTLSTVQGTPEFWRRYSLTVPPSNPI